MCRSKAEGGRRCSCATPGNRRVEHAVTSVKRWEEKLESMEGDGTSDERFEQASGRYIEAMNRLVERERERGIENSALGPPEPTRADEYTPESVSTMNDEQFSQEHTLVWGQDPGAAYRLAMADRPFLTEEDLRDPPPPPPPLPDEEEHGAYDEYVPSEHDEIGAMAGNLSRDEYAREEWDRYCIGSYIDAEESTNGAILNRKGREAGIDSMSLFSGSAVRASRYASDELKAYWQKNGRHTAASHRYSLLRRPSDRVAYERATTEGMFDDAPAI